MADSAVAISDFTGTSRPVESQLVGSSYQQTVTLGNGADAGRVAGVDSGGHLVTRATPVASATGTITSVAGSATTVPLLASNTARLSWAIFNESTVVLCVALASSASLTAYTFQLNPGAYYEPPAGFLYTGTISGIWASAAGAARITEYT